MSKRTKSQIGRASRRKGKAFERWCARYFTKWTGLKWETTRNSGRTDLKGDIYAVSRPDLPLIVECKDDKRYTVHAMLKPTKAFVETMSYIRLDRLRYGDNLIIIVKNPTGVWVHQEINNILAGDASDVICTIGAGNWCRLQHLLGGEVDGVTFDAKRLEGANQEGKEQRHGLRESVVQT